MAEMTLDEIARLSFAEAYELMLTLGQDDGSLVKEKDKLAIRFGIRCRFDIHLYLNGLFNVEDRLGYVRIGSLRIRIEDFFTEVEARRVLVRRILVRGLIDKNPLGPRD